MKCVCFKCSKLLVSKDKYKQALQSKFKFQDLPDKCYNAHHLFVIEVKNRKDFYDFLRSKGIYAQIHYIPVHTLPYYKEIGYASASLVNAENYYEACISLPMYPSLSNEELDYVIETVLSFESAYYFQ